MFLSKVTPLNNNENNNKCLICNDNLTVNNSVTPMCKHTHCYKCFWKWAEKNDSCPFCRGKLIPIDRTKEIEMKNLLDRRREIVINLDELYNDYEIKKNHYNCINKKIRILQNRKKNINLMINELEYKFDYIDKKIKYKLNLYNKINDWKENPSSVEFCSKNRDF